jgi:hypothetical protein
MKDSIGSHNNPNNFDDNSLISNDFSLPTNSSSPPTSLITSSDGKQKTLRKQIQLTDLESQIEDNARKDDFSLLIMGRSDLKGTKEGQSIFDAKLKEVKELKEKEKETENKLGFEFELNVLHLNEDDNTDNKSKTNESDESIDETNNSTQFCSRMKSNWNGIDCTWNIGPKLNKEGVRRYRIKSEFTISY